MDNRTLNALTASLLVEELIRNGVDRFCLAPGSRCTPLTLAVARHEDARIFKHFDERGLGYFALGLARGDGQPAVVITTSGTAVANLLPAVVEADLEDLPLIVLSADRPPELRDTAANQTIDQVKIFGERVRWFVDLPCPSTQMSPNFFLQTIDHAVARSRTGPVHLNAMYREPLSPEDRGLNLSPWLETVDAWMGSDDPHTRYAETERAPVESTAKTLADDLADCRSGVLVVGRLHSEDDRTNACTLGEILGWPIVADMSSGLRTGKPSAHVIHAMDVLLQHEASMSDAPDAVIHLGGRITSKRVQEWINRHPPLVYALCHDSDHRTAPGPLTHRASGSVRYFCEDLAREIKPVGDRSWLERWQQRQTIAETVLAERLQGVLSEPGIARAISANLPAGHQLFLGNSMPVRDMNQFATPECRASHVHANRGASGIDGVIATAAGVAESSRQPLTLVIGDLSALHDLNSLSLLRDASVPITVVVINNDGGGIFSFLSIARHPEVFEEFFGTPHGMQFEHAAAQFGLQYHGVNGFAELVSAYTQAVEGATSSLIEVTTQRDINVSDHQAIRDAVIEQLDG